LTLDGKIVASKRIEDEGALKLDLSKLSTGVYFVQVVTANVSITQEILKE